MSIYNRIKDDIAQDYYVNNYPNDGQRFIAWYLRNIYNLDQYEAKNCITDGADDKQIDAVYISTQDETIYIIQGKFNAKGKLDSKPLKEVLSSWVQIKNLQNLQENANDRLKAKIGEISSALDDDYDICFELLTTSELTKSAQKDLEIFRQELADSDSLSASLVLVDENTLETRYNDSLNINRPYVNYDFTLEAGKYMELNINGTKAVIAVISLHDCLNIPGIQDGSLFRKNVRQSLGTKVKVNKEIAQTLKKNAGEFFFLHNGITAICSSLTVHDGVMSVKNLNVVNGCQSLTTIYSNSEAVKKQGEGYIIFRFYEITDTERADKISTSTNSQNAVKARDLRSNDKYVLALKKSYEHCYPGGQLITKRGEKAETGKNPLYVIELSLLGKLLITWHLHRPTVTHEESKIFSDHFSKLFHRNYEPEKVQALNEIYSAVFDKWKPENSNPLDIRETLFVLKSYAAYMHLFAVSVLLCEINKIQPDMTPAPDTALRIMKDSGTFGDVIEIAGYSVNDAFMASEDEARENGRGFNPPNWPKTGKSLAAIRSAINKRLTPYSKEDKKFIAGLKEKLKMSKRDFEPVWTSDND